jgi:sulfite reductase (NADPH) flavoprotein alpha-component
MAGLGTGAAPFRAFIQHRAWQKSQGIEVGPLVYYFGSRYSSQEYLYGCVCLSTPFSFSFRLLQTS